jgi:uncharacterized integral membrane protein
MSDNPDVDDDFVEIPDEILEAEIVSDSIIPATTDSVITPPPVAPSMPEYKGSGFRWSYLFGIVLTLVVMILVFQNFQATDFSFLTWTISAPLAVIIIGTALIAVIVDEIVGVIWRARRRKLMRQKAELKKLRKATAPPKEPRFRTRTKE